MDIKTKGGLTYSEIQNDSIYHPPWLLRSGHIQSVYPTFFRSPNPIAYRRTRVTLTDGDFIDLDWSYASQATGSSVSLPSSKLMLILHGLEGCSKSNYVYGMFHTFLEQGFDCVAMNLRGCSGEPNKKLYAYHSGKSEDLKEVVEYILQQYCYQALYLIGVSIGGNILLKYLGENSNVLPFELVGACAISTPCDLHSCAVELSKWQNKLYMQRFLQLLKQKLILKQKVYPDQIDLTDYNRIRNFFEFDDRYTAPFHGFKNAEDYYEKSSAMKYMSSIKVPTLLINAIDDPFLGESCYPDKSIFTNQQLTLLQPQYGGHAGFVQFNQKNRYWHEQQALSFAQRCG